MEELPDKNIFMMCPALRQQATRKLPEGFHIRSMRRDEFHIWKAMPFDDPEDVKAYDGFMEDFYKSTYSSKADEFFQHTQFVCNQEDIPVATCMIWKAYDAINTIHWLKVLKSYEGLGIGRALLSELMIPLKASDYPLYLHTQPESFRAIKLYSDFGFNLLSGEEFGGRKNHLDECLTYLKKQMPYADFENLVISRAPQEFVDLLVSQSTIEF